MARISFLLLTLPMFSSFSPLVFLRYLILDETALAPGQLSETGIHNLNALHSLLQWQRVEYDFSYHKTEFLSDIPVLVLSQGKSFLPCDCQVLLSTSSHVPQSPKDSCKTGRGDKLLEKWRIYLAFLRYFDLGPTDPGIKKHLEDDFVESRQKDPSITPESFHLWLTISRYLSSVTSRCTPCNIGVK